MAEALEEAGCTLILGGPFDFCTRSIPIPIYSLRDYEHNSQDLG